ncbi:MAG: TspO/MBR family protein [Pseudomonadota bacterium]
MVAAFVVFFVACCGAAATGGLFPPDEEWYRKELKRPSWNPPDWLFPVAWTLLYFAISYAAARVATSADTGAGLALGFWAAQIAFNALWTPVFFGKRMLGAALGVLCALWLLVLGTAVTFFQVDAVAGWLILPYVVWVSYALALNAWIWRANPA